jgi:hypothetical protein
MLLTLLPYIALALNLILVLGLFFGLNRSVWKLRNRIGKCECKLESATVRITEGVNELSRKVSELEEADTEPLAAGGATLANGLNTTLRSKVLKMHRMGQSRDNIADSLRVPRGEVDLLVKVHRIVMRPYEDGQKPSTTECGGLKKS